MVKATDRQTESNARLVAGIDTSAPSLIAATNREKALAEAREKYLPGPDRDAAVDKLTASYARQTAAAADLASVTKSFDQRDQLAVIQAETASLGQNEQLRTKEIALLQAKQALLRQGADLTSEASKANLANAAAIQDATAAFQRQKTAMDELSGFFTNTFDTISTAITSAFATGEKSAIKFKDITKSVITALVAELLKLAVLNPLKNLFFGGSSATLSSVGGVIGNLFGGSSSVSTTGGSAGSAVAALTGAGSVFGGPGVTPDANGNVPAPADSGTSLTTLAGYGSLLTKGLNFITGGSLTDAIANVFSSTLVAPLTNAVGGALGGSTAAGVESLASTGFQSISGLSSAQLAAASNVSLVTEGGASAAAAASGVGSAASSVLAAVPYLAAVYAAYNIGQQFASGDTKGGLISLVFGSTIGSFFGGSHPLNKYQDTQVDVKEGRVVSGTQASQVISSRDTAASVDDFGQALGDYMKQVGIVLTNADGAIGHVGENIKGLDQAASVADLFNRLKFAGDPNDTSNFGVAKNALAGRQFQNGGELTDQIGKIAAFADTMDKLGFHLAAVGTDLTNITIASVSLTGALTGTAEAANDNPDPLRTALNFDLSGKTFATVDALSAEIDKVNTFVNSTMPGLLNPVLKTSSAVVEAVQKTWDDYSSAIIQATAYGLGTEGLEAARGKAIDMVRQSSRDAIDANTAGFSLRQNAAGGGVLGGAPKQMFDFEQSQAAERTAYTKAWKDTYGDLILTNADYLQHMVALERTQGAERVAAARQIQEQLVAQWRALTDSTTGFVARLQAVRGDTQGAELTTYDVKAAQERAAYIKGFVDFYGDSILANTDFQNQVALVDQVHYEERLAIQRKYADAAAQQAEQAASAAAQQMEQARQNVKGVLSGLADYARDLGTSDKSPLSAADQLDLARNQFNAVAGAAGAGDYNSITKVQGYADSFLGASRNVNGSTAGYVSDFQRVTDVLESIGNVSIDTLTASAQQAIMQNVADQVTDELVLLRQEVSALRAEMRQGSAAPVRMAA